MKILLTGGSGFIGQYLYKILDKEGHLVLTPRKKDLDLTNVDSLKNYFKSQKFPIDLVIHAAILNGKEYHHFNENIAMFYNLCKHKKYFKYLINIASGAEFDQSKNISKETNDLNNSFPYDIYGFSKNIISRILHSQPHFYNLRLYGCFGLGELTKRFMVTNITNYIKDKPIEIHQDRYFDFFNLKDVVKVIKYYIESFEKNLPLEKDIDLVYPDKLKLSDIANIINNLSDKKVKINIQKPNLDLSYTGTSGVPYDIKFDGLEKGIRQIYNTLFKSYVL